MARQSRASRARNRLYKLGALAILIPCAAILTAAAFAIHSPVALAGACIVVALAFGAVVVAD